MVESHIIVEEMEYAYNPRKRTASRANNTPSGRIKVYLDMSGAPHYRGEIQGENFNHVFGDNFDHIHPLLSQMRGNNGEPSSTLPIMRDDDDILVPWHPFRIATPREHLNISASRLPKTNHDIDLDTQKQLAAFNQAFARATNSIPQVAHHKDKASSLLTPPESPLKPAQVLPAAPAPLYQRQNENGAKRILPTLPMHKYAPCRYFRRFGTQNVVDKKQDSRAPIGGIEMRPPLDDPSFPPLPRILVDNERLESLEPKLRAFIKRYKRAEYTFLSNARRWSKVAFAPLENSLPGGVITHFMAEIETLPFHNSKQWDSQQPRLKLLILLRFAELIRNVLSEVLEKAEGSANPNVDTLQCLRQELNEKEAGELRELCRMLMNVQDIKGYWDPIIEMQYGKPIHELAFPPLAQ